MQHAVNQRIKFLANSLNLNQNRLATVLGVTRSAVSLIYLEKNGVKAETLSHLVSAYPYINANWLLTGQGQPFLEEKPQKSIANSEGSGDDGLAQNFTECYFLPHSMFTNLLNISV